MGDERSPGSEPRSDTVCLVYESHGQDCRYRPLGNICSTISQKYGTGGGNVPIILEIHDKDIDRKEII